MASLPMNGSRTTGASQAGVTTVTSAVHTVAERAAGRTLERECGAGRTFGDELAQDQARGRHTGAGGDQHVLDVGHRVHGRAPQLADSLGDAVHTVDVGLAELPAMGVDRQPTTHLDGTVGDEVLGFAFATEPQLL